MYVYTTTTMYHDTESARVVADEPRYHQGEEGGRGGYKPGAERVVPKSNLVDEGTRQKEIPRSIIILARFLTLLSILRSRFTITICLNTKVSFFFVLFTTYISLYLYIFYLCVIRIINGKSSLAFASKIPGPY